MIVLDASAALAYLLAEPGGELVRENISECVITSVNFIEVLKRLRRDLDDTQVKAIHDAFKSKIHKVVEVEQDDALIGSQIYADFQKSHNIALGDAVCLAVGIRLQMEVWTADSAWSTLPDAGKIKLIR